ncbi:MULTISPECIES: caspase family protein [Nostocales]|uniref:Peptidase C14 caspase catalytic subunit p20 n=1 Tax=Dolichospermum planctonicum TaxID=136072 RepID=A0A480AKA0_9CYAN|nr:MULTISPECIES: caspase family protein [Nostocales]MBD2270511.1 caspase family protein [Anabaena sp. FACHB-1391]GCL43778.1 peptidase C14 caspase catalytic subunit p20 [Dolichospermum planctonicum]
MVNYWAIAIGINQYQLFQPLGCAQADAEAIKGFLVTQAGFPPENCLLMTNTSPPIGDKSSYPTKENILSLLQELAATFWQPEDYLWLFFSGYGVNYKEQDYLMPVGGDPEQVAETGIEVRSLMQSLEFTGIKVLLIFDINRAFGTQADAPVGQEIIELAAQLQMGAIISCQPEEFSHESTELGHGFFTAALLEALGSGKGYDFGDLASYLSYLTPKLCQYHWRPVQNPITVIPTQQPAILPILTLDENSAAIIFPEASFAVTRTAPPLKNSDFITTIDQADWTENASVATTLNKIPTELVSESIVENNHTLETAPISHWEGRFIPSPITTAKDKASSPSEKPLWQQFIIWGGGNMVIVALLATFLLRHHENFRFKNLSKTVFDNTTSATQFPQLSPTTQNRSTSKISLNTDSKKRNQAILELGKMSLVPTQPGDLVTAIAKARKIKANTPIYAKAQENIQVWCQMILELAQAQAEQRKYENAIATAQLITKKEPLYSQAETVIKKWQIEAKQYVSNKTLLDTATALIIPEQASTYNRAIAVAKKIQRGQPGFEIAQTSINQWSEKILNLAKIRANQGDFQGAISTAILVPTGAIAYEDAQDAMQKWQLQKN